MSELEQLIEQLKSLTESNGELAQTYKDFLRDQVLDMGRRSNDFEVLGFGTDYNMQAFADAGYPWGENWNFGSEGLERDIQNRAFSSSDPEAVNDWQEIQNLKTKTQAHLDYLMSPEAAWGEGYIYSDENGLEWGEGVLDKELAERQRKMAEAEEYFRNKDRMATPHDAGTMAGVVERANLYANAEDSQAAREEMARLDKQKQLDEALYQYNLDKHNSSHPFDVDNADVPGSNPAPLDLNPNNANLQKLVAVVGGAFIAAGVGVLIAKGVAEKVMDFTNEVQGRNREYGAVSEMNFATTLREVFKEMRDVRLGNAEAQAATMLTMEEEKRRLQTEEFRKQLEILENGVGAVMEKNLTELLEFLEPVIRAATEWMKKVNIATGTYDPNMDSPAAGTAAALMRWNAEQSAKEAKAEKGWSNQMEKLGWKF